MARSKTGIERIAAERKRQVASEGYDAKHDAEHNDYSLAWAAVCYAAPDPVFRQQIYAASVSYEDPWPWERRFDKRQYEGNVLQEPTKAQYIRQLEKAGALIAAEIDRLLRE